MSDLAKFVAASIRDKALVDVLEENRQLQEENRKMQRFYPFRRLKITGPEGKPVYLDKEVHVGDQDALFMHLNCDSTAKDWGKHLRDATLGELVHSEIYVDGSIAAVVGTGSQFYTRSFDDEGILEIMLVAEGSDESRPRSRLDDFYMYVRLGPLSKEDMGILLPDPEKWSQEDISLEHLIQLETATKVSYYIYRDWFLRQLAVSFDR